MLFVGLMSGTSADAVDAALVRIEDPRHLELVGFAAHPLPEALRERVHAAAAGKVALRDLLELDRLLGETFGDAALAVLASAGVAAGEVEAIGSHGQTVAHHPEPHVRGSLQIASASVIHARTRIPVVSDFRSADLAAGGQGAPLTPFLHAVALSSPDEPRAVLNIGGFTNLTWLPDADPRHVIAFDPGPGNALIDRAARWASGGSERFDRDGARCRAGRADAEAVAELIDGHAYFAAPPPKSTGHETFGAACFEALRDRVLERGGGPDDVAATCALLCVESVVRAASDFLPAPPRRWLLYGGGVHNPVLMEGLRQRLEPAAVETTDGHGLPSDALEAMAFALFARCARHGLPSNLPSATGATHAVCLGSLTPPHAFADPGRGARSREPRLHL